MEGGMQSEHHGRSLHLGVSPFVLVLLVDVLSVMHAFIQTHTLNLIASVQVLVKWLLKG